MHITEIRVYPIKSIRGVSLQSQQATAVGFDHDRIFMLQRVEDNKNMHVPNFPSMCLFTTELSPPSNPTKVIVRYGKDHTFDRPDQKLSSDAEVLEVPLQPDKTTLQRCDVNLHGSVAGQAYVMPEYCNKWFTDRFGFEVRLNYIGEIRRPILGNYNPKAKQTFVGDPDPVTGKQENENTSGWLGGLKAGVGSVIQTAASYARMESLLGLDEGLRFSDTAAFLVVNAKSYEEVKRRVGNDIDVEKFRPNIVVDGACQPFDEDYWGLISIGKEKNFGIMFTANCGRCASLNVDYETGKIGQGPTGEVLKSLQSDRRIDPGHKWSPIFGRYGFLATKNGTQLENSVTIKVGDEVEISTKNERRTHMFWPGIGTYKNVASR